MVNFNYKWFGSLEIFSRVQKSIIYDDIKTNENAALLNEINKEKIFLDEFY